MRVYIDGENCRKGLSRALVKASVISSPREMTNYKLRELLQDVLGTDDLQIDYYASKIKLPEGYQPSPEIEQHVEKIRNYNRTWIPCLQKQRITYRKAGYLKPRSAEPCKSCGKAQDTLQEKGVDVRIASDMLEDAYKGNQTVVALMSSDTDFRPAVDKIIAHDGVKIIYICFATFVTLSISSVVDETVTISMEKIKKYYVEPDQPQLTLDTV